MLLDYARKYNQGGEVITEHGWDYKREGDNYLTKRVDDEEWITAKGTPLQHIKAKVYKEDEAIQQIAREEPQQAQSPSQTTSPSPTSTVKPSKGTFSYTPGKGGWEQTMQEFLVSKGENLGTSGVGGRGIDGEWGPRSQAALERWQKKEDPWGLPTVTTDDFEESCTKEGCAYIAGAKVANLMGSAAAPGSDNWVRDAWFNKDYHLKQGGDLLYNEPKRGGMGDVPEQIYGSLRVGDYVGLNRRGSPNQGKEDEFMPSLQNENIEHLGMIIGKDDRGVPMVYHGSKSGKAYIQPIDKQLSLPDVGYNYWISSITRPAGLKDAKFDHLQKSPYHGTFDADEENKLVAKSTANAFQTQAIGTINNNMESLMRQGFDQDEVNTAAQILLGIGEMESTGDRSWGRHAKEAVSLWYKNFAPSWYGDVFGKSIDLPFEVEIGGRKINRIPTPGVGEASRGPYQMKPEMHFGTDDEPTRLGGVLAMSLGIQPEDVGSMLGTKDETYTLAGMTLLLDNLKYLKNHKDYNAEDGTFQGVSLPYALAKTWQGGKGYVNLDSKQELLKDYDVTYSEKALGKASELSGTEQNINSLKDSVEHMEEGITRREKEDLEEMSKLMEKLINTDDPNIVNMFSHPAESTSTYAAESTYIQRPNIEIDEDSWSGFAEGGPKLPEKKEEKKENKGMWDSLNYKPYQKDLTKWGFLNAPRNGGMQAESNLVFGGGLNYKPTGTGIHGVGVVPVQNNPVFKGVASLGVRQDIGDRLNIGANVDLPFLNHWETGDRMPIKPQLKGSLKYNFKKGGKVNPWAICTKSAGRSDKDKYERCVMRVKKKHGLIDTIKR